MKTNVSLNSLERVMSNLFFFHKHEILSIDKKPARNNKKLNIIQNRISAPKRTIRCDLQKWLQKSFLKPLIQSYERFLQYFFSFTNMRLAIEKNTGK